MLELWQGERLVSVLSSWLVVSHGEHAASAGLLK